MNSEQEEGNSSLRFTCGGWLDDFIAQYGWKEGLHYTEKHYSACLCFFVTRARFLTPALESKWKKVGH